MMRDVLKDWVGKEVFVTVDAGLFVCGRLTHVADDHIVVEHGETGAPWPQLVALTHVCAVREIRNAAEEIDAVSGDM